MFWSYSDSWFPKVALNVFASSMSMLDSLRFVALDWVFRWAGGGLEGGPNLLSSKRGVGGGVRGVCDR